MAGKARWSGFLGIALVVTLTSVQARAADGGPGALGAPCAGAADCGTGTGLQCVTAGSQLIGGQGPAKGLCTASCTSDTTCQTLSPTSRCVTLGPRFSTDSYCLESCRFSLASTVNFDPAKCHGRHEMACKPYQGQVAGEGLCAPTCNADADCGAGLFCDPGTGLCRSTALSGPGPGSTCSTTADTCRGDCLAFATRSQGNINMCAEACTFGAVPGCGWSGVGPADAFCMYSYQAVYDAGGPGIGDAGLCTKLCDCDAQCGRPELGCISGDAAFVPLTKRKGFCSPPFDTSGQPVPTIKDCTGPSDASSAGGASGSGGGSGASGASGASGTGGDGATTGTDASAVGGAGGGGGASGAGVPDGGGARAGSCGAGKVLLNGRCVAGQKAAASQDDGGCGCRAIGGDATSRGALGVGGLALLLALGRRRKAHERRRAR